MARGTATVAADAVVADAVVADAAVAVVVVADAGGAVVATELALMLAFALARDFVTSLASRCLFNEFMVGLRNLGGSIGLCLVSVVFLTAACIGVLD